MSGLVSVLLVSDVWSGVCVVCLVWCLFCVSGLVSVLCVWCLCCMFGQSVMCVPNVCVCMVFSFDADMSFLVSVLHDLKHLSDT